MVSKIQIGTVLLLSFSIIFSDWILGKIFEHLYNNSKNYTIRKLNNSINYSSADIIILGSSRAQHHYIPKILVNNTGQSVYNCGFGGQGLGFSYIQLRMLTKRYTPKLVILDVSPNILLDQSSDEKMKILTPYARQDTCILNLLTNGKYYERIKYVSNLYLYNSTFVNLISGLFFKKIDSLDGFIPLHGIIDSLNYNYYYIKQNKIPASKFVYLSKIINLCCSKAIPIIIIVSPILYSDDNLNMLINQIKLFCTAYKNIQFIDDSKFEKTYLRYKKFQDSYHMNYEGAYDFSVEISNYLKDNNARMR